MTSWINTNFFEASEAGEKAELLAKIRGKKILWLIFNFNDGCDLGRFYVVNSEDGETCSVEHLARKLDDFDNG